MVCNFTGIPFAFLKEKIGEPKLQCLAGMFTVIGTITAAFTSQAWQGMITIGILHGTTYADLYRFTHQIAQQTQFTCSVLNVLCSVSHGLKYVICKQKSNYLNTCI